jgi:hypothetical protein
LANRLTIPASTEYGGSIKVPGPMSLMIAEACTAALKPAVPQ